MGQNLIEFISEAAFVSLGKLEVLHLDGNQLASVPSADTLRPLASTLLSLNLGQNAIQKLESEVFLPLKNLKSLNLTGASIVNISYDAFRGLSGNTGGHSGLQILSLASNALDRFPNLGLLHRLQRLEIGGNFIEKIRALDLTGLSSLQVRLFFLNSQCLKVTQKCRISVFQLWYFPLLIFCPFKIALSGFQT